MIRRIKHILNWLPILWGDRDWDYDFLLRIMEFKLNRMANCIEKNNHLLYNDQYVREMRVCATLLNRIREDKYCYNEREDLNRVDKKSYLRVLRKAEKIKDHDIELFFKLFKSQYRHWWD